MTKLAKIEDGEEQNPMEEYVEDGNHLAVIINRFLSENQISQAIQICILFYRIGV